MSDTPNSAICCNRWIAFTWREQVGMNRSPERLAMVNEIAVERLRTLVERENRDRPQGEMAYLETLITEVLLHVKPTGTPRSLYMDLNGVEWTEESAKTDLHAGATGVIRMYLDPELPIEIEFLAEIESVQPEGSHRRVRVRFIGLSDPVSDLYQQLLFIYHRRSHRMASESTSTGA